MLKWLFKNPFVYVPVGPHSYKYRFKYLIFSPHFALLQNHTFTWFTLRIEKCPYTQYNDTREHRDTMRWKRHNGLISCWLYSLALETAGTHKDHEPFLTGHPGVTGFLWVKKKSMVQVHVKWSKYCKNTPELRNYWLHDYCVGIEI